MAGKQTGRRGNREGSIRLRPDGRWEARISLPDGRRKSFFAKTRADAAKKMTEAAAERDKGIYTVTDDRQTLGNYLTQWLETQRPPIVKPRTWDRYELDIRLHITPALGRIRLTKLTAIQVQSFYAAKRAEGLSPASIAHIHAVLHAALEDGERLGVVARNVAHVVTAPRPAKRDMHVLTSEQAKTLLNAIQNNRLGALYVLALATTMRQGELLALRWDDVDLETGNLSVQHTLHFPKRGGSTWERPEPKSESGRRSIHLAPMAIEALRKHHARQIEEREVYGPLWTDTGLIFTRPGGEPLRGQHVTERMFKPILKQAGLPVIRFHDLRHTAATLLLASGIPTKVVSEMLGHASAAFTLEVYAHVLPSMQKDAAAAIEKLLGGQPE
jgi:integrase